MATNADSPTGSTENEQPTALQDVTEAAEQVVDAAERVTPGDAKEGDTETLGEAVAALKEAGNAVEDARKDVAEEELDDRVDVGGSVAGMTRVEGSRRYVKDEQVALLTLREAGGNPEDVFDVKAKDLVDALDTLGANPDPHIGTYSYTYYR